MLKGLAEDRKLAGFLNLPDERQSRLDLEHGSGPEDSVGHGLGGPPSESVPSYSAKEHCCLFYLVLVAILYSIFCSMACWWSVSSVGKKS